MVNKLCKCNPAISLPICGNCHVEQSPDSNVEDLRDLLLQRSVVGLAKYGVTTDNNPLSLRDWLQHALEETLDKAVYLRAAIRKLDEEGSKHDDA